MDYLFMDLGNIIRTYTYEPIVSKLVQSGIYPSSLKLKEASKDFEQKAISLQSKSDVSSLLDSLEKFKQLKESEEQEITKQREVESQKASALANVKPNLKTSLEILISSVREVHAGSSKNKTTINKISVILDTLLTGKQGLGKSYFIDDKKYATLMGHVEKVTVEKEKTTLKELID